MHKFIPANIIISVRDNGHGGIAGHVLSTYYNKVFVFKDECAMLLSISQLCDCIGLPEKHFKCRDFKVKHIKTIKRKVYKFMDDDIHDVVKGDKATFLVHIQYRENSTWQGNITWIEKDKRQNFRSALEMLALIDETGHPGIKETIKWNEDDSAKKSAT